MLQTLARTRIHGGNRWELMRQHGFSNDEILDFSVDVNPLGFPASVRSVILEHVDEIRCYPDPAATALREAIAASHHIPPETVLPGNGAAELINLVVQYRLSAAGLPLGGGRQVAGRRQAGRPSRALIVVPTFGEYEWAIEHAGASPLFMPTRDAEGFRLAVGRQEWPRLLDGVDLMFLCNPNNPTGVMMSRADVLEIAHQCHEAGTLLVIDEAFVECVGCPDEVSVIPDAIDLGHIVLRSLTKCFAMPGLRLGYLAAQPSMVEDLRALQPAWPLNTFALEVGIELFKETAYAARSRSVVAEWRGEFQRALRTIPGLHPFPSAANFILCKLTFSTLTSSDLCERLAHHAILIRNCDSFTGLEPGRFIRLAVRTRTENHRLLAVLREVLRDVG